MIWPFAAGAYLPPFTTVRMSRVCPDNAMGCASTTRTLLLVEVVVVTVAVVVVVVVDDHTLIHNDA